MNKLTRFVFYAVLALVVLTGVLEAVLWLAMPVDADPGTKLILNNRIFGFKEKVTFEVGPDSLRRDGWTDGAKPDGTLRVVCLGGPGTVGVLQNVEDTWWSQLRRMLQAAHPDKKFEFGALGVDSQGCLFGGKWAQTYLPDWNPDLVIAQYGIEDVLIHPESYRYDPEKGSKLKIKVERSGLKGLLIRASQVCRRISLSRSESRQMLRQKQYGQMDFYAGILNNSRLRYQELDLVFKIERPEGGDPIAEYKDGLSAIVTAAREAGAKVLLTGEPSLCSEFSGTVERSRMMYSVTVNDPEKPIRKPEPGWVESELFRYYRGGRSYAASSRVPFIDLHTQVPQDPTYFLNEMILTDAGATKVAELLLPEVEKLLAGKE